jgi:oligo-1,6-glucosidase
MALNGNVKRSGWWKDAIIYQIWPKSFNSGKGSPTGDIAGIIAKLDYIKSLGANTIWVSPHYKSPMIDEGYDISDYEDVNPDFGTVADAEQLIKEVHQRDMRIIFDLVINHTSDQHKWFQESRSSKTNPKRDWYIWRPAKYDANGKRQPPNNWASNFSQSAWTWDEKTEEYFLHLFAIEQPDINWTNAECRKALLESSMEFWLKRGVNGFRVDTVNMYSKPMDFPDAPITVPGSDIQPASSLYCNGPEMHNYLREMGDILDKYDAMTVGELPCTSDPKQVLEYVGFARNELSMVFQFDTADLGKSPGDVFAFKPWTVSDFANITDKWQTFTDGNDGWTTSFIENHDQGRANSRFGNDKPEYHDASSKMLALLTILSSGTPFIYMGQEIGMTNVPLSWDYKEYLDLNTINYIQRLKDQGKSEDEIIEKYMPAINLHARDNARTPVQWTDGPNAGFTKEGVKPWMRVNDNYKQINAAQQLKDENSILSFWKQAIALRKEHPALFTYGKFTSLLDYSGAKDQKVFAFSKDAAGEKASSAANKRAIVLLNFSAQEQKVDISEVAKGKVAISTHKNTDASAPLKAYEGRVLLL